MSGYRFFAAFREIHFPRFLVELGFNDASESSDRSALATLPLADGGLINVWVNADARIHRATDADPKFAVNYQPNPENDELFAELYRGESAAHAEAAIKEKLASIERAREQVEGTKDWAGSEPLNPADFPQSPRAGAVVSHAILTVISDAITQYNELGNSSDGEIHSISAVVEGLKIVVTVLENTDAPNTFNTSHYELTLTKY